MNRRLSRFNIVSLVAGFAFERIGRAPARFDPAELEALNARLLHETDYGRVSPRLAALGVGRVLVPVTPMAGLPAKVKSPDDALVWRDIIDKYRTV